MARAWIGTSGYDYKEWKPSFYPADLAQGSFLQHYASRFNSVELNNTFYRMPTTSMIAAWREATHENFRFAVKVSRRITHQERLKLPSDALEYLLEAAGGLGPRLGVLLFQLPPNFKADLERLERFLGALPPDVPAAFEFRHDSWLQDDVYRLLEGASVALCIHDTDEGTTPLRVTGPRVYARLRRSEYPEAALRQWQQRIRGWVAEGLDVFAYIKHEDNPEAPAIAASLAAGV